ncbi:MAG TPA: signal recognition particle protein [Planctomycetaceae bacterium]|nr:signal recognition particle protein [Planctomycetaceae bacterium]
MFESLQQGLTSALKTIRGHAKLTEANMRDGLRLVRQALLEADVSLPAVKDFMARVSEQALGEKVLTSLKPDQHLIGIVHQELINLMGPVDHSLHLQSDVTILMLCGLQGSGKTTTCGKLGRLINERGKKPLLVAADLQRPAAIHQLEVLGEQLGLAVYSDKNETNPVKVCNDAVKHARQIGAEVVILDTAGRLHIDSELMAQLERIDRQCNPEQIYLVVDAMTGQDAVNSAKAFNDALELDGVIMTKLDGDARGGAALSVKAVADVPIKFIGTGEHMDALEEFHPDRMAGRILGMGDVLTLVEQAQQKFDQEEMTRQQARLEKGEFTLDDLKKMFNQIKRLGSIGKIMGMIPGMGQMAEMMDGAESEKGMRRMLGVIDSMTADERRNPRKIIDQSRRRRIAAGAGVEPHEVNELVKTFDAMAGAMKAAGGKGRRAQAKAMQELVKEGMMNPGGKFSKKKQSTGKRLSSQEKAKLKKVREREQRRKKRQDRQQ